MQYFVMPQINQNHHAPKLFTPNKISEISNKIKIKGKFNFVREEPSNADKKV